MYLSLSLFNSLVHTLGEITMYRRNLGVSVSHPVQILTPRCRDGSAGKGACTKPRDLSFILGIHTIEENQLNVVL